MVVERGVFCLFILLNGILFVNLLSASLVWLDILMKVYAFILDAKSGKFHLKRGKQTLIACYACIRRDHTGECGVAYLFQGLPEPRAG